MWTSGGIGLNYGAAATGRLWSATSNTSQVAPDWIGNTVFNEMAPILVLCNPAASNVRANILTLALFLTNLPGDIVHFRVISDRINRLVPLSGTQHVDGNADSVFTLPTYVTRPGMTGVLQVYDEVPDYEASTLTQTFNRSDAVGGTVAVPCLPNEIDYGILPAGKGNSGVFAFNGALIMEPNTTAAIYAWSASTAPQGRFALRWTEEKLVVGI